MLRSFCGVSPNVLSMSGTRNLRNSAQDSSVEENKCGDTRRSNALFRPRPRLPMQAPCCGLQQPVSRVYPACLPLNAFHGEVPSYRRSPLCCFPEPCMNPMESLYACESPGPMYCCPEPDYCCMMANPFDKMCCSPFEPVLYEPCQGVGVPPPALRYRQQGPPRRPTYPKGITCCPPIPPAYRPVLPLPYDPLKDPRKSGKDPCCDEAARCDPCCGRPFPVQDRPIPAPPTCGLPAPFMCPLPPPMEECCRPQIFTPIALQNASPCYCDRHEPQCCCCIQEASEREECIDSVDIVQCSDEAIDAYNDQIAEAFDNDISENGAELLEGDVQSYNTSPQYYKGSSKIKSSSRSVSGTARSQLSHQNEPSIIAVAANGPAALQLGSGIGPEPTSLSDLPKINSSVVQRGPSPKYESKINATSKTNKGLPSPTNPEVWLLRDTNENIPGTAPSTVSESIGSRSQLSNNKAMQMYDECLQEQDVPWVDNCEPLSESLKKNLGRIKHGRHRRFRRTPIRSFQKTSPSALSNRAPVDPISSPTSLAIQSTVVPPPGSESVRMRVTAPYDPNLHMTIRSQVVGPEGYISMNETASNMDESEQQQVQTKQPGNRRKRRYNHAYGRPSPAPKIGYQF